MTAKIEGSRAQRWKGFVLLVATLSACTSEPAPSASAPKAAPASAVSTHDVTRNAKAAQSAATTAKAAPLERDFSKTSDAELSVACDEGDTKSCIELADRARSKAKATADDYAQALALYQSLCDRNVADGCAGVGVMYQEGYGVTPDTERALSMYRRACDAKSGRGCSRLGVLYALGLGVPSSNEHALGFSEAGCDLGDAMGCVNLGVMYQHGDGVPVDGNRAREAFRSACRLNAGEGCRQLGALYAQGVGAEQANPKLATMFADKACALGDATGCGNAGMNHQLGFGVPKNPRRAAELYQRACKLGEERFCALLERFARGAGESTAR